MTLEKTALRLGYIPLIDCLPLVIAQERGFFAAHGLAVELNCEASWANIRDKLIVGHLDGAQMLAPMLLAASLGVGGLRKPMLTAFSLGLNGNAITVSNNLFNALREKATGESALDAANALAAVVQARKSAGQDPLVLATVFPFSSHNYLLRYWLSAAGIDPRSDIKLVALPPQQMVDNLRLEHIDGFCVGEPWNSCAAAMGLGKCLLTGYEIWQNGPEKVFGVTEQWQQQNPNTHAAVLRALDEAAAWIEDHRIEALQILDRGHYLDVPLEWLAQSLSGDLRVGLAQSKRSADYFHVFHRYQANFPWRSHAQWFLQQMQRWQQVHGEIDAAAVATRVYRSDLYREIFNGTHNLPVADVKSEGTHAGVWTMPGARGDVELGPDLLIDSAVFNSR
ncbi:MAG: CmpA/NrtA family ABC transporter substrate-binding protein [Spongiibacteraceae bacterium]